MDASRYNRRASCHCRNLEIDFVAPEDIQDLEFIVCNCSICTKNGYINYYVPKEDFDLKTRDKSPQAYSFAPHNRKHHFCPMCGTSLYIMSNNHIPDNGKIGINLRAVEGLDVMKLKIKVVDGKSRNPKDKMEEWRKAKDADL